MKKTLLTLTLILAATTAGAQELVYSYDNESKTATVTYPTDEHGNRVSYSAALKEIPDTAPNGYRVTAIGPLALDGCHTSELTIPASVELVGNNALTGMIYLKKVTFADSDQPLTLKPDTIWPVGGTFCGNNVMEEVYIGRNLAFDEEGYGPLNSGRDNPSYSLLNVVIGEKVTRIPKKLFSGCRKLQGITIGSNATDIGESAFEYCSSLKQIDLPEGLTIIRANTFASCDSLTVINIPSTLKEIGEGAFSACGIETLTIPAGMEKIGDNALVGMSKLKKVIFEDSDTPLFIGTDTTWPVGGAFNGNKVMKEVYIGRNLTYNEDGYLPLNGGADPPSVSLQKVVIGEKVTSIPYGLFNGCSKLSDLTWGSNVTEVGAAAFKGCKSLKSIILPEGITIIKDNTFQDCDSLTSIQLPPSLVELGQAALNGCDSLQELTIPGTIEVIGYDAFCYTGIKRLTISDGSGSCQLAGTSSMASGQFRYTQNLTYFYMGKDLVLVDDRSPYHWSECKTTDIVVGPMVTKIEPDMFKMGADYAVNVHLGSGLKAIGKYNFGGCKDLVSLTCDAVEPPACEDKTVFQNVNKETCKLYVPAESIEAYKAADVWKDFFNIEATSGIKDVISADDLDNVWYDLNGHRVDIKTAKKGIYVSGKKKYVK